MSCAPYSNGNGNELKETEVFLASSIQSQGVEWVEPQYKKNPPPVYPRQALLRSMEGVIILVVYINKEGLPTSIEVEKSSGFYLLDRAAVKAVWKWQFVSAKRGRISVDSKVRVPVQFRIGGRWN